MTRDRVKKILQETLPAEILKGYPEIVDAIAERVERDVVEPDTRKGIAVVVGDYMSEKNLVEAGKVEQIVQATLEHIRSEARK